MKLDDDLSKRTIEFVNRFKLLKHQANTPNGFSATLFEDTKVDSKDLQYIFAIRGTEISDFVADIFDADMDLSIGQLPLNQYLDMIGFYAQCAKEFPSLKKPHSLIIVGHSLGGALAQLLIFSLVMI